MTDWKPPTDTNNQEMAAERARREEEERIAAEEEEGSSAKNPARNEFLIGSVEISHLDSGFRRAEDEVTQGVYRVSQLHTISPAKLQTGNRTRPGTRIYKTIPTHQSIRTPTGALPVLPEQSIYPLRTRIPR